MVRLVTSLSRFLRLATALCAALVLLAARAAGPWPVAESDLPPLPGLRQGTLPNGLRYLVLPNAEPRDRVSLRLVIAAGSLHESDEERGLAHFVEHMAFRSTRSHPDDTLIRALQRLGLGLGPDSTAFTTYDHTIYQLELPDPKPTTLREGLRVLREFASEVTFDPKLIERERGVILSEKATRDTAQARVGEANLAFLFRDSRLAQRAVIGRSDQIRAFTREQFISFYDAWYRPERMAVIAVGAIEPEAVAALVREEFAALAGRGSPRPEPAHLSPERAVRPDIQIYADPAYAGVGFTFEHPVARPNRRSTHEDRVRSMHEALAFMMLSLRLNRIAAEPDSTFITPEARLTFFPAGWVIPSIVAAGRNSDWQRVIIDIEREHRRAYEHGFLAAELKEAKASYAASMDQAVRTSPTWPSPWYARRLADSILAGFALASAESGRADLAPALEAATPEDCSRAFRALWTKAAPHVYVSANPSFRITNQQIADALNKARETPVDPPVQLAVPVFAYTDFGPPGKLVSDEQVPDLDVRLTRFANGVRANFKSTDFAADAVEVRVRIGDGRLSQPAKQPGLDHIATSALLPGGIGRHPTEEIRRLLAGHPIYYYFEVMSDHLRFTAHCPRRDLLLCLQLLAAHVTDPAYRPEAMRDVRTRLSSLYSSLGGSPGGPISMFAPRIMFRGDTRFGPPGPAEANARTLDEVRAWLSPQFKEGPIELSVVGEVTWDEAKDAIARTFGALPARTERGAPPEIAQLGFSRATKAPQFYMIDARLGRSALALYLPVPDVTDTHTERRCHMLARVVGDRLRVSLRELLGASYTPGASFQFTRGFPKLNYFMLYAEVAPARMQDALKIINKELVALSTDGPDADEYARAREPYLHSTSDDLRTNIYWGATVLLEAQQYPNRLDAARDRDTDNYAITQAELSALARRYLAPDDAFTFVTVPVAVAPNPAPRPR